MPVLVYAILDSKQINDSISHGLDFLSSCSTVQLEFVTSSTLTAIVSSQPDNNSSNSRQEVLAYAGIVDKIFERYSILPMRYGSVVASCADVTALLEKNSESFLKVLNKIMHKEEYSLRLFFSHQHQGDLVHENSVNVTLSPPEILLGNTETKNYLLKKYQEHIVEEKRLKYIEKIQSAITEDLKKITDVVDFNKRATSGCIIDAVLLIERAAKNELLSLVAEMQSRYPEHNVILTGPWPPYNFAQIKLE